MNDNEPIIITSPLSRKVTSDGISVSVEIYRLETEKTWTLEVVDKDWNSTVWDDLFATDEAAYVEFEQALKEHGMVKLLEGDEAQTIH